jgi:hypothetical protein
MEENLQSSNTKVLFVNLSSSLSCGNLGSSGPTLPHLVIHPFLDPRTERESALSRVLTGIIPVSNSLRPLGQTPLRESGGNIPCKLGQCKQALTFLPVGVW